MKFLIIGKETNRIQNLLKLSIGEDASITMVKNPYIVRGFNYYELSKIDVILVYFEFNLKLLYEKLLETTLTSTVIPIVVYGPKLSEDQLRNILQNDGVKGFLSIDSSVEQVREKINLKTLKLKEQHFVYNSENIIKAYEIADKVACSNAHVLITGESGTGKEVLASYIHKKSLRKNSPFVGVNCAAIPEQLIESELFGYEKGSFTGAINQKIGKFELSSGGTLLLDEVSEMDIRLQSKLLRAIQEKEVTRIGGNNPCKVDLRIISTSNRNLKQEILLNHFREDLFFRLNVIEIELPSLRSRVEDIPLLVEYFIDKYSRENNIDRKQFTEEAIQKLKSYSWPGNIRELENFVHKMILLTNSKFITLDNVTESLFNNFLCEKFFVNKDNNNNSTKKFEAEVIFNTVKYCLGNFNQASKILGISVNRIKNILE